MIHDLKPYPAMKDSGVLCVGEVSAHWELRRLRKDRNRLYWEDFKQTSPPYPPPDEQSGIADSIDESILAVNRAINRSEKEISNHRENLTRLITEVVTGKVLRA